MNLFAPAPTHTYICSTRVGTGLDPQPKAPLTLDPQHKATLPPRAHPYEYR